MLTILELLMLYLLIGNQVASQIIPRLQARSKHLSDQHKKMRKFWENPPTDPARIQATLLGCLEFDKDYRKLDRTMHRYLRLHHRWPTWTAAIYFTMELMVTWPFRLHLLK